MGVSCAAFIGWKHRAQARVSSVNTCRFNTRRNAPSSGTGRESPRECPKETIGHTACSERSALLQSARENNTSRAFFFDPPTSLSLRAVFNQRNSELRCVSPRRSFAPMCSHCFVSHIRRGPESIYTGGRLRHRGPLAEERFASGVVDPADCGPRAGSEIDSAELRHLGSKTQRRHWYKQGGKKWH